MQTLYYDLRNTRGLQQEVREKINAIAQLLREGALVALPTETVYGLGANGLDGSAVRKIFEAKGRPQDNPLILHISGAQWLPRYCAEVPPLAYALTRKFWPGPLTLVLKRRSIVPDETTAALNTVAVRCPNQPVTLAIIRKAGVPIAAPSANLSGRPSCTTAEEVREDMDGKINAIVDGGPCAVGVESTILDLTGPRPRLLRPGGVSVDAIERLSGPILIDRAVEGMLPEGEKPAAPGMKYRHYAPKAPLTVFTGSPDNTAREMVSQAKPATGILCFDEYAHLFPEQEVHTFGSRSDHAEQAQRIFPALRGFDRSDVIEIFAQCPDTEGLGLAVSNRLKRAAGFHIVETDVHRVVLGLTGGTGAGKTTALDAIRELGGIVIDADEAYHELLEEDEAIQQELRDAFPGAAAPDGTLDRRKLGREVFSNRDRMEKLNGIVRDYLLPALEKRLDAVTDGLCAVDGVTLVESGFDRLCDRTVAVTAPTELRIRRIMARDGIPEDYARLRVQAQQTDEFYRGKCDLELVNTAETPAAFREEALSFFRKLVNQIQEEKRKGIFRPSHPADGETGQGTL